MKKITVLFNLCAALSFIDPTASFAGWGAIAVDNSGDWGTASGYGDQGSAEAEAMSQCMLHSSGGCYLNGWEQNECIYGPYGTWACN